MTVERTGNGTQNAERSGSGGSAEQQWRAAAERVAANNNASQQPAAPRQSSRTFGQCAATCATEQFGLQTLLGAGGAASGLPTEPYPRQGLGGGKSTGKTSIASKYLSRAMPWKLPFRVPTPTWKVARAGTATVGRIAGRAVPFLGWGLLAYDAGSIAWCTKKCMDGK